MEENLGHIESHVKEMYDYQLDPAFIEDKLIDLEGRSSRNNLKVDGIKERSNEVWEDSENELHDHFKESLDIEEEVVIERTHSVKIDKSKKSNTPRTIVCRILNYKDKVKILRNVKKRKGGNTFVNEDFCHATVDHRKELWKEVKRLREEGKITYLQYWSNVFKRKDNTGWCLVKIEKK